MALYFHKIPIVLSSKTLSELVVRFQKYTATIEYPLADEENYEKCRSTIALLHSGIRQIREGREILQKLYNEIRDDYRNCKSKTERKELIAEIEQIEQESQVQIAIADASELIFKLTTRYDESRSAREGMGIKLGYISLKNSGTDTTGDLDIQVVQKGNNESISLHKHFNAASFESDTQTSPRSEQNNSGQRTFRSINPPQASLPTFSGNAEEFAEYWAIFEAMVHNSERLDVVEKIILLRESLKGRARNAILGIQPLPENYDWMIKTLKETYCNYSANRSQIVQKLLSMTEAHSNADSCLSVIEQIQVLINQMVSAGYDIRNTCDPMWSETILAKFPQDVIKPVLIVCQSQPNQTIEGLMGHLKKEIAAKGYVENRLGHKTNSRVIPSKEKHINARPYGNEGCLFCQRDNHSSMSCRTVDDKTTRRKIIKEQDRCWKCFSDDHNSFDCQQPDCIQCGQKHHVSLCSKRDSGPPRNQNRTWNPPQRNNQASHSQARPQYSRNNDRRIENIRFPNSNAQTFAEVEQPIASKNGTFTSQLILMTAEGNIWNHRKEEYDKVLFFFDCGAQKTVIEESLATDLGLPRETTELCTMSGIGGHIERFESHIVNVKVGTVFGEQLELKFQTKPVITNGFPSVRLAQSDIEFLKENNICPANSKLRGEHQIPHVLVGLDYFHDLVTSPTCGIKTPTGLHISKTVFGPTIYGKGITSSETASNNLSYGMTAVSEPSEKEILQKMFELEGLGISNEESQPDDKTTKYLEQYSKKLVITNGCITAPFPLKDNILELEDNYSIAIRRLESLQNSLLQNPQQCKWYCEILQNYQRAGMIETFTAAEDNAVGTYYMPHSGVWKSSKKVPLRIVFDASSKRRGKLSLNDVIHKGEAFVNKIHDILLSSRSGKIILICDIEAAFTQIRLLNSHKDLCRFLWVRSMNAPPTRDNLIQYRFKRLPFGVTASPSVLNMALSAFLNSKNTELASEICSNLYVDNILLRADTISEALDKYKESKKLFAEIGMNLREYISNCTDLNNLIPYEDRLESNRMKLLGVDYQTNSDVFQVTTKFFPVIKLTKKDIVSQINSVYDPIGAVGPLLVHLKSMMREVFDTGVDWKCNLSMEICDKWNRLCKDVHNATVTVSRPITSGGKMRLWVFADASKAAIATCAYGQDIITGSVSCLISGKTRLTPKKSPQTIPRLEFIGLLMAARLCDSIVSNMATIIESTSIVTDSEIALWWLKSTKKLPIFAANMRLRIQKIEESVASRGIPMSFFHVATSHNPADAGTRGLTTESIKNHDWVQGPRWLESSQNTWPLKSIEHVKDIAGEMEIEAPALIEIAPRASKTLTPVIDLTRFSSLNKALRTASLVGKLLNKWAAKTNIHRSTVIILSRLSKYDDVSEITPNDIDHSERMILAQEQNEIPLNELQKRFPDKKLILDDNGLIRHKSRLQHAEIPQDTKCPIYVPCKSELVRLIVQQIHRGNAHCGKEHTLSIARQRFWIPRPSNAFKKFLKNCSTCRRYQGLPLGAPTLPSLPRDRVIASSPFQNTGCDFMGPFTSKTNDKMYVCLYTCLTTRAVHLEVVENLSTGAFLNSFTRFISRRGVPKLIRSDCGTNFKHGEQIIATMFERNESTGQSLMTYCATERIKWIFNPPASPWMGGVWERLVGLVKKALNKSIGRKKLDFSEMNTVITRIEAILNTRPLTKLNIDDIAEIPLRPIDFLHRNLAFSLPEGESARDDNDPSYDPEFIQSRKQAIEAITFSEKIADKFWDTWRSEYLVALREMQKQQLRQPRHLARDCPELGEVVLIEQDLLPRGSWPYGKITEIIASSDGLVRSAKILMPNKNLIHRPLNKIYPLEIRSAANAPCDLILESGKDTNSNEVVPDLSPLPLTGTSSRHGLPRAAKARAYEFFKNMEQHVSVATTSTARSTLQ